MLFGKTFVALVALLKSAAAGDDHEYNFQCGDEHIVPYEDSSLTINVEMPGPGHLKLDCTSSDFAISNIRVADENDDIRDVERAADLVYVLNQDHRELLTFTVSAAAGTTGNLDLEIICEFTGTGNPTGYPTEEPTANTPAPSEEPTYSPTTDAPTTKMPTAKPTPMPSPNPTPSPTDQEAVVIIPNQGGGKGKGKGKGPKGKRGKSKGKGKGKGKHAALPGMITELRDPKATTYSDATMETYALYFCTSLLLCNTMCWALYCCHKRRMDRRTSKYKVLFEINTTAAEETDIEEQIILA